MLGLMALVMAVIIFFYNHVPMKGYYDEENRALVISPGLLYTLEGYHAEVIYGDEFLLFSSEPGDRDLRFDLALVAGAYNSAYTEIRITYRDRLTGKTGNWEIQVHQQLQQSYGSYEFRAAGSGINCAFSIPAGK